MPASSASPCVASLTGSEIAEFSQFGTNLISVTPGKIQTHGASLGAVNTVLLPGKKKRRGMRVAGYTKDRRKAIITLAKGQILEDYGV